MLLCNIMNEIHLIFLCRRKPQNLTPPGSSDSGSSGSGQSPTSTHPGSPPSAISSSSSMKRPGYIDGADGLPTKRKRISHYRNKPTDQAPVVAKLPDSSQQQRSTPADSSLASQHDDFFRHKDRDKSRDVTNVNRHCREYGGSRGSSGGSDTLLRNDAYSNHNNSIVSAATDGKWSCGPENESDDKRSGSSAQVGYDSVVANKAHCVSVASNSSGDSGVSGGTRVTSASVDDSSTSWNRLTENGVLSQSTSSRGHGGHHDNRNNRWTTRVSSSTQNNSVVGSSPESQLENVDTGNEKESKDKMSESTNSEYPEYLL